jgi:hypothetical protein
MIDLLVICDLAQITQDGKLSILGMFGQVQGNRLPMRYPRFFLVGCLSGEPFSEHLLSFSLTGPDGKNIIDEYEMTTRYGYDGKANIINDMTGTIFSYYGIHTVTLTIDRNDKRSTTLLVTKSEKTALQKGNQVVN